MHREVVSSTKDSPISTMLFSFGLVVLLVFVVGLANLMYNRYGISYSGYLAFLSYILIGVYVYRRKILKYQYLVVDQEFIVETLVGKRSREIIRVKLNKVLYFCPLSYEKKDGDTSYKSHYVVFNRNSPRAWVLAFKEGDKIHRVIMEPSDKLIELVKKG